MSVSVVDERSAGGVGGRQGSREVRIGLVATDPLRILGLQQMLAADEGEVEVFPLSVPGILRDTTLTNVLIDGSCTEHLLELLGTFRRMRPQVRLIVIGDSAEPTYIQQVIGAGARGYVTHTTTQRELQMALAMVNDGSVWAPRRVLAKLLERTSESAMGGRGELAFTPRELEILALLEDGRQNQGIADGLGIGVTTVKAHVTRLMRKVGVQNRVELTLYALRRQIV